MRKLGEVCGAPITWNFPKVWGCEAELLCAMKNTYFLEYFG